MPSSSASSRQDRVHWIVRMNRRNRSASFALLAVAMGSHLYAIGAPAWAWGALALNFLLYPQLAYWRARRARDQRRAELQNMDADFVLGGIWMAALGLPLWITFIFCASGCINLVVFHGARGVPRLLLDLVAGIAIGAAAAQPAWHPDTDLRTSVLCMVALELYLFVFARDGYDRAMAQYKANAQLHEQYGRIHALQTQLREQALRDPLTGLFNRRQLDAVLAPMLQRCRDSATPLALVAIDIDRFKSINDTRGHAAGDAVLRALARLLLRHVRAQDLAFRVGGEEFLLVLSGASPAEAMERAQVLCATFERLRVRWANGESSATLSCGVAGFPRHADEPLALLACADQALYAAKAQGRNRVVVYEGPQGGAAPGLPPEGDKETEGSPARS
ncbi:MAG: diguanylate cyclase [Xenophilus sp.]